LKTTGFNALALFLIAALAILMSPALASACPSCFAASSVHALRAYYLSTMLLTLMPFTLISLFVILGYSSYRRGLRRQMGSE